MTPTLTRSEVYDLIDGERAYQDRLWNASTTTTEGNHSFEEWIMYIEHYLAKAKVILCTGGQPAADGEAGHAMRKVAALAVAAIENKGAPAR